VRCAADDRRALEQLCRYITRPALPNERVQCNAGGQVVLKLKTPWRDDTTHRVTFRSCVARPCHRACGKASKWREKSVRSAMRTRRLCTSIKPCSWNAANVRLTVSSASPR
jgi:hypothetical protein